MSIPILMADVEVIQKLSDLPNANEGLSAAELKQRLDSCDLRERFNLLLALLETALGAEIKEEAE